MSDQHFRETHHEDKTSKWVAWIIAGTVIVVSAIGLSWNESSKTAKKIIKTEAVVDSLSEEVAWRQKAISHHDSLQAIVDDSKNFRKMPSKTRQEISTELAQTTPKIASTKHNLEIFQKLLDTEKQNLANLQSNKFYQIYN